MLENVESQIESRRVPGFPHPSNTLQFGGSNASKLIPPLAATRMNQGRRPHTEGGSRTGPRQGGKRMTQNSTELQAFWKEFATQPLKNQLQAAYKDVFPNLVFAGEQGGQSSTMRGNGPTSGHHSSAIASFAASTRPNYQPSRRTTAGSTEAVRAHTADSIRGISVQRIVANADIH